MFDWYWKVYRFYWNNLTPRTIYYGIKNGVSNLIQWLPIIWHDRDWDEYFLLAMLHKKFKNMEHYHKKYGISANAENVAHELMVCKNLCKRLMEEKYTNPYEERNKPHFEWFHENFEKAMHSEPDENGLIMITKHDDPDEPDGRWILPAHHHEEYLAKQDVELLAKYMMRCMRGWWD